MCQESFCNYVEQRFGFDAKSLTEATFVHQKNLLRGGLKPQLICCEEVVSAISVR